MNARQQARKRAGLTPKAAAKVAGISLDYYRHIERHGNCTPLRAQRLARATGTQPWVWF